MTHRLKCCEFAGWDSAAQFTVVKVNSSTSHNQRSPSLPESCSDSSEKQGGDGEKEMEKKTGEMQKDTINSCGGMEGREGGKEVEISPGQRLSIVVTCQAK